MAVCKKIRSKNRKLCIGDLDRYITIQDREITAPAGASVDFSEQFIETENVWASVETKSGVTAFDSTGQEVVVTHVFGMRYLPGITSETWILFEGNRYDVLPVQDLDERHEFLLLQTTFRGLSTKDVNAA